jgi:PAS domain S-box-containing protein
MDEPLQPLPSRDDSDRFTPDERAVLDETRSAIAACEVGLDDETLQRVKNALRRVVSFDRMALHVEDDEGRSFWVLWRDPPASSAPQSFATGVHFPADPAQAALTNRVPHEIVITNDIAEDGTPTERALYRTGVRSYIVVPLVYRGEDAGWITFAHEVRGASSQAAAPLLRAVTTLLAPALVRARQLARGRLFEALVEDAPDGMLALDRVGTVVEVNRAALRLLVSARSEVLGRSVAAVLGASVADVLTSPWGDASENKTIAIDEGGPRLAIDAVVARVEGSAEAAFQVHLRDARGRRAAEEATTRRVDHFAFLRGLSESMTGDLRVQTALERAATFCAGRTEVGGVMMFRAEGEEALRLMVARGVSERTQKRVAHVTVKELEEILDTQATDVRRAHGVVEAVGAAIDPETTGLVPRWKILVPLAHARRPLGAMLVLGKPGAVLTDSSRELWESVAGTISAALHAADDFEQVVALEAEKRLLVDSLPIIVARVDPKTGATLFVNAAIERVLGFEAADVQGLPGMDALFADPIEWEASALARDRAARGRESTWQDRRYKHKDGRVLILRENVYPVRDAIGAVRAIEVLAYDVTTELESRKQLMQADRLASLGALAGGIAHEINNPVAFIGLAVGQISKMIETSRSEADVGRAKQLLQEVSEAAGRIANIVGELKLFTRIPEGAHVTPVDVNRIVQMAVTLTSAELRRRARVEVNLGELPLAPGEYSSLGQAFVNLLLNAAQAIDAIRDPSRPPCFVRVSTFVVDGSIVVRVSDTGVGIEPRILPRIFDPFFKMNAAGEGAGLGLAIAHNLVRRVGGDIRVTSKPGEGTTFDVVLPADAPLDGLRTTPSTSMRAASVMAVSTPPTGSGGVRGRVLIVDDEQALAKALARQLADRWDVDTVSTARDALAELSVHRYDVVACDLRMPDQSGPAIYDAIRARSPRQASRFIFTTGGSYGVDDDPIHERALATGRPILEKPFHGANFEALVAEVAAQKDDAT